MSWKIQKMAKSITVHTKLRTTINLWQRKIHSKITTKKNLYEQKTCRLEQSCENKFVVTEKFDFKMWSISKLLACSAVFRLSVFLQKQCNTLFSFDSLKQVSRFLLRYCWKDSVNSHRGTHLSNWK